MAIRDDNSTPPTTPGSITRTADTQMDRINNISNVSKTVSNMQKEVKQKVTEAKSTVKDSESIASVQSSMNKVLDKLGKTIDTLSSGVKTITVDTAKATKDAIGQYGKAISEDISFNKQSIVAMALAKSTPIYGYFVAKFMETDIWKQAAQRMKTSIGKVFGSLAGVFRRGAKAPGKERIPHMQKGGFVERGGVAKLHPAEVVVPIEKVLSRIDEQISITKSLTDIAKKQQLASVTSAKAFRQMILTEQEKREFITGKREEKPGLIKDFFKILKAERMHKTESVDVQQLRALLAIQDALGTKLDTWPQVWTKLLLRHPSFRTMVVLGRRMGQLVNLVAWKPVYAIFKTRGGYRRYLSKSEQPLVAMNQNIGLTYVESMWRFDNMLNLLRAIAEATRDTAGVVTGKKYKRLKGIGTGEWSLASLTLRTGGLILGGALSLAGGLRGLRTGQGFKKGAKGEGLDLLKASWRGRQGEKLSPTELLLRGAGALTGGSLGILGGLLGKATGKGYEKGANLLWGRKLQKLSLSAEHYGLEETEASGMFGSQKTPMYVRDVTLLNVEKQFQGFYQEMYRRIPKQAKELKLIAVSSKEQTGMLRKVGRALKGNRWIKLLLMAWGALKFIWNNTAGRLFKGITSKILTWLGISKGGKLLTSGLFGKLFGRKNNISVFGKGKGSFWKRTKDLFGKKGPLRKGISKIFGKEGFLKSSLTGLFGKEGFLRRSLTGLFGKEGFLKSSLTGLFGKEGFLRRSLTGLFGKEGFLKSSLTGLFGKEGFLLNSAKNIFGKTGFLRTAITGVFGKTGFLRTAITGVFGKTGFLRTAITGVFGKGGFLLQGLSKLWTVGSPIVSSIGKGLVGMLSSPMFWGALAAAGIGVAIGSLVNKFLINPVVNILDKRQKERNKASAIKVAAEEKERVKTFHTTPRTAENMEKLWQAKRKHELLFFQKGITKERRKQMSGILGGEVYLDQINTAQKEYMLDHETTYLQYDVDEIRALRKEWIYHNYFRNRAAFEDATSYGKKREAAFLTYLKAKGTKLTAPKLAAKAAEWKKEHLQKNKSPIAKIKIQATEKANQFLQSLKGKTRAAILKGASSEWFKALDGKSRAAYQDAKKYYMDNLHIGEEQVDKFLLKMAIESGEGIDLLYGPKGLKESKTKVLTKEAQVITKNFLNSLSGKATTAAVAAKGTASEWWKSLDSKSKTAYKSTRKYFMDKLHLSEEVADRYLMKMAAENVEGIDFLYGPKGLKESKAKDIAKIASHLREKIPGAIDKTKIAINNAILDLSSSHYLSKEFGKQLKDQAKHIVESTKDMGEKMGGAVIHVANTTLNHSSNSSTIANSGQNQNSDYSRRHYQHSLMEGRMD